jgi:hypothetical protein
LGKINRIATRKSEAKRESPVSQAHKPEPFQTRSSSIDGILFLQRTVGNQAVQKLFKSGTIQAEPKIGKPGEKYEQEADRVADQVMRMPEPLVQKQPEEEEEEEEAIQPKPLANQITPLVQRQVELGEEEEEPIQAKKTGGQTRVISSSLQSRINSLKGSGRPLPESTRRCLESRFGSSFNDVRIYNNSQAANIAKSINAKAFTTGKDIVFGAGQYSPATSTGKKLLTHELTHIVQQSSSRGSIQRQKLTPFKQAEIKPLETLYNAANRAAHNCISILNKAVKTVYSEELKNEKLKSTIQDTMKKLEGLNLVGKPTVIEFLDSTAKVTKGTIKPNKLSQSVEGYLLSLSAPLNGWYLYGLSIMDGYHSVLIAVQVTGDKAKVHWLDQTEGFKDVTGKLDSMIEEKTIRWWEGVKASKGVGYKTRTTFWPFAWVLGDFPRPAKEYRYA